MTILPTFGGPSKNVKRTQIRSTLGAATRCFRAAVSLHSHTLHSRESLEFIYQIAAKIPPLAAAIKRYEERYHRLSGRILDLSRAWWTPPLSPHAAWALEASQIEDKLQLRSLVSLTDHDTIEAPALLRVLHPDADVPVSVEWTTPYGASFLHFGIHNLPPDSASAIFSELANYTRQPNPSRFDELLTWLQEFREVLVVLNHPCWDERGIGEQKHLALVKQLLRRQSVRIHALELNGLRPWTENCQTARLAEAFQIPLISGGDRHGREPNSVLNLTSAHTFSEFVEEVRFDRKSEIFLAAHHEEPLRLRFLKGISDALHHDQDHSHGWSRWSDRVFYLCDDGETRSLTQLWGASSPGIVRAFVGLIRLAEHRRMQGILRFVFAEKPRYQYESLAPQGSFLH